MTTTQPRTPLSASAPTGGRYGYDVDEGYAPSGCYVIVDRETGDAWFGARLSKAGLRRVRAEVDRLNATVA